MSDISDDDAYKIVSDEDDDVYQDDEPATKKRATGKNKVTKAKANGDSENVKPRVIKRKQAKKSEDPELNANAGVGEDGNAESPPKPKAKAAAKPRAKKATGPKAAAGKKKTSALEDGNAGAESEESDDSDFKFAEKETVLERNIGSAADDKRTVEEIYQKKTPLEHILLRPDTYIGSVEHIKQEMWVLDSEEKHMKKREIEYVPGLYKIVDEIIVNAADNKIRDPGMNKIKVDIDREKNVISVYNNGKGIPVQIHKEAGVYVPEFIFGHLLTSSNYNDSEKKLTGGRNGYGAKLANIFSTEFIVETADLTNGKSFKQIFSDNMSKKTKPVVKDYKGKEEFTKITFKPDLAKFGMTELDSDFESLIKKRVYDLAGTVRDVKVFLNNEQIKIKNFQKYVEFYLQSTKNGSAGEESTQRKPILLYECDRWEIALSVSEGQFEQVSFVNSICTTKGGTHVNHIADQIVDYIKNSAKMKLKPFQIKSQMWVFVNCLIENPSFDSQTKDTLTLVHRKFGSTCVIPPEKLKKVLKSELLENIDSMAKFKQEQEKKKTDGAKRSRITGIPKLDDANNAGTRRAKDCTLILTEGDSAKALAVAGLSEVGRDDFGVFPLRGKLLNVREASHTQVINNQEINHIKRILGLKHGIKYTSTDELRYGKLMIMTDQDHDGSHIKGLIINFLDHFYPSLLELDFLDEFITPIVRVTKGNQDQAFFTMVEFEQWKESQPDGGKSWKIKYYKGLGTSTNKDAKNYFSNLNIHRKRFEPVTPTDRQMIDLAFNKKKADERKEWLRQYQAFSYMDHTESSISISDFVNKELIHFSMADNVRSIPSMVDGLKPGQRKVMYGAIKKKIRDEIKVLQLQGYISEQTAYHHGDASLNATIVGLAQKFVGSNNINLLEPIGQFGTRYKGGKNAASARYISTALSPLARKLLHPSDDNLLEYLNEDNLSIEPKWYVPVIPLVLINGSEGIGTGWSSFIPNYNPEDIIDNIKRLLRGEEMVPMHPWYRGYKGKIERFDNKSYKVTGIIEKREENILEITELPIRVWTENYKEQLELWIAGTDKQGAIIKDYKEIGVDDKIHFELKLTDEQMRKAEEDGLEKTFKLSTTLSMNNMVCFDKEGRIKKYQSVEEILQEFYDIRFEYYQRRKQKLLDKFREDYKILDNRARFILMVIQGKLIIANRKEADVVADLRAHKFDPVHASNEQGEEEEGEDEGEQKKSRDHGYNYLLSMQMRSMTIERVEKLMKEKEAKQRELDALIPLTVADLWTRDLDDFLEEWKAELERDRLAELSATSNKKGKRARKSYTKSTAKKAAKPSVSAASKLQATLDSLFFSSAASGAAASPSLSAENADSSAISLPDSPVVKQEPVDQKPSEAKLVKATKRAPKQPRQPKATAPKAQALKESDDETEKSSEPPAPRPQRARKKMTYMEISELDDDANLPINKDDEDDDFVDNGDDNDFDYDF
ncbi:uncharacterized protein VTP21DRAFT_4676 [Calcarisporiella thermophila]|uniref:uncharacterized protein n=1 Tax=Calcarisporiella thermophila TaxID=911321 RepID=UPI00374491BE